MGTIRRLKERIHNCRQWILFTQQEYDLVAADPDYERIRIDDIDDIETGFSDDYEICACSCNGCQNVIRVSPDCYDWKPPTYIDCEGYYCNDCAAENVDSVKEEYEGKSIPEPFTPSDFNLVCVSDDWLENGLHHGMNDDPEQAKKILRDEGIEHWFELEPSQFYVRFKIWVNPDDLETAKQLLSESECKEYPTPAQKCEAALKGLKLEPSVPGMIQVSTINVADGTAETRHVTQEEFIKGVK